MTSAFSCLNCVNSIGMVKKLVGLQSLLQFSYFSVSFIFQKMGQLRYASQKHTMHTSRSMAIAIITIFFRHPVIYTNLFDLHNFPVAKTFLTGNAIGLLSPLKEKEYYIPGITFSEGDT